MGHQLAQHELGGDVIGGLLMSDRLVMMGLVPPCLLEMLVKEGLGRDSREEQVAERNES